MRRFYLGLCFLVAVYATADAQITREAAIANGWAAIRALRQSTDPLPPDATATGPHNSAIPANRQLWLVSFGEDTADVDSITGEVWMVDLGAAHDRIYKPPSSSSDESQVLRSSSAAIEAARTLADRLGWPVGESAECLSAFPKLDAKGVGPRALILVIFRGERNGYRSGLDDVSITMESTTGGLVDATRSTGYTFQPPSLKVDAAQAEAIARAAGSGEPTTPVVPAYDSMPGLPSETENQRAIRLGADKEAILMYRINGTKKIVFIAGDTGEVLDAFSSATADGESYLKRLNSDPALRDAVQQPAVVRNETYQPPKPPVFEWDRAQVGGAAAAVAGVLIVAGGALYWRRRRTR